MSGNTDRLAEIEAQVRAHLDPTPGRLLPFKPDDVRALVEIATQLREALDELEQAVSASLGTMNFYFGPNARTGVSRENENKWKRIAAARDAARAALATDRTEAQP